MNPDFRIVWVFHQNCRKGCTHCFCKPSPFSTAKQADTLVESLKEKGYRVAVMATDPADPEVSHLVLGSGYGVIDLKDEIAEDYVATMNDRDIELGFSLHGHTAEIHELICSKGNFEDTLRTMEKVKEMGIPKWHVDTVIHRKNYRFLREIVELALSFGARKIKMMKLTHAGLAKRNHKDLFMDDDHLLEFFDILKRVQKDYGKRMEFHLIGQSFGRVLSSPKYALMRLNAMLFPDSKRISCKCSRTEVCIHAGTLAVYPCRYTVTDDRFIIGRYDMEKGIIIERNIWFDNLHERIGEPCKSCPILPSCGGYCRAQAVVEHERRTGEFDYYAGLDGCPVILGYKEPWTFRELLSLGVRILRK